MRKRFTPATLLAAIALIVALAGAATAGTITLITGKQIKDGSIGAVDLSKSAPNLESHARGASGGGTRQADREVD